MMSCHVAPHIPSRRGIECRLPGCLHGDHPLFGVRAEQVSAFLLGFIGRQVTLVQNITKHLRRLFVCVKVSYFIPPPRRGIFLDKASLGCRLANFRDNRSDNKRFVGPGRCCGVVFCACRHQLAKALIPLCIDQEQMALI